jgi:hypothetical protein
MKIEVTYIKQNEDGSATILVDTDAEANEFLLKYGIVSAIEDAVTKSKKEYTLKEHVATDKEIEHGMMKSEIYEMRKILAVQDEKLQEQALQLVEYNNTIETMGQLLDSYLAKHKAREQE